MTASRTTARRSSASPADRRAALAATALAAAAAAGCGFGPGDSETGEATIRVTRDYGAELVSESAVTDPTESDTVMRALDSHAEIETRYGGGFVQSIEGIEGGTDGGRSLDWFFYVNGVESSIGAADVRLHAGDSVWWDYRDWTEAMRVPAVVGSWPQPFAADDEVDLACAGDEAPCSAAAETLDEEGVETRMRPFGEAQGRSGEAPSLLVGPWASLRTDPAARLIEDGPAQSGVFADFGRANGRWRLDALDQTGQVADSLESGGGLVAALHPGEDAAVWVVTGTDAAGVEAAAERLDEDDLRDRYAVAVGDGGAEALPAAGAGG